MDIEINFQAHIPIYIQVMDQIKQMIAAGELNPDDQLPTVRGLASEIEVNFNTIARAYRLLDDAGIISTQHGRGTFILDQPSDEDAEELRRQNFIRLTENFLMEAHRLGYPPNEIKAILDQHIALWLQSGLPQFTQ